MLGYLTARERAQEVGEDWPARYLRTTSPLEPANRGFRQKAREVGVFGSTAGLQAGVGIVLAHWQPTPPDAATWAEALERALLAT